MGSVVRPLMPRDTAPDRYVVGLPKTVPMTPDEYARVVHFWAVLIAAWWTDNPPGEDAE